MAINTSRLDRLISELCQINKKKVRLMLAQQRITVDGVLALD
ncbi:MAG: 16S rRNA pseudouridine516 synthase, partial [Colwellia sp.]